MTVTDKPGEVVARSMDADRLARYVDRWVDFVNGLVVAAVTALIAGTWLAGAVLITVMVASALASTAGRRVAGRSAAAASTSRARFGQSLVSALESVRTVKLAAATPQVHAHLREVDGGRVDAAVREHRVQALLDGVPVVMVQLGVVAAWAGREVGTLVPCFRVCRTRTIERCAASGFDLRRALPYSRPGSCSPRSCWPGWTPSKRSSRPAPRAGRSGSSAPPAGGPTSSGPMARPACAIAACSTPTAV